MNENLFFCDTNILRYLIDNPKKWLAVQTYLSTSNLLLVLSWIQIIELSKVPHYHSGISSMLLSTPSALLKWWKDLLKEEIEQYPNTAAVDPIQRPLVSDYLQGFAGQQILQALFSTYQVNVMSRVIDENKEQYMRVMAWLSTTSPKPTADMNADFSLHNFGFVLSELGEVNDQFVSGFIGKEEKPLVEAFRGSYIRAAYTYYRYIKDKYAPQPSDIGDLHQVFYTPYCQTVVLEKSMAGILHQLQKEKALAPKTEIKSIRFVRNSGL